MCAERSERVVVRRPVAQRALLETRSTSYRELLTADGAGRAPGGRSARIGGGRFATNLAIAICTAFARDTSLLPQPNPGEHSYEQMAGFGDRTGGPERRFVGHHQGRHFEG